MNGKKKHTHEQLDHYIAEWLTLRDIVYDYIQHLKYINNDKFDGKIPDAPGIKIPEKPR
jgi:hypothetical protein